MSEDTFLDIDTTGAQEPSAMPGGEYQVQIVSAVIDLDKNDHQYFLPRFEILNEPYSKEFTKFFGLPHAEKTEKQLNSDKFALESFKTCFGIKKQKFSMDDIVGLTGWVILGLGKEDPEYGVQNYIKKFILPK